MTNKNTNTLSSIYNTTKELSYEEAFEKLQNIVNKMQQDNITLEETVNLYKEGRELTQHCNQLLEEAKVEIEDLMKDDQEKN